MTFICVVYDACVYLAYCTAKRCITFLNLSCLDVLCLMFVSYKSGGYTTVPVEDPFLVVVTLLLPHYYSSCCHKQIEAFLNRFKQKKKSVLLA